MPTLALLQCAHDTCLPFLVVDCDLRVPLFPVAVCNVVFLSLFEYSRD